MRSPLRLPNMPVHFEDMPEEMKEESMEDIANESESSDESMESENVDESREETKSEVYLPGQALQEGEELTVDKSAYRLLHHAQSGAPCLSFDVIPDDLGHSRESYPLSMYIVAGTQAAKAHVNNLLVMKMSNLHSSKQCSTDSESESSDSEDEDDDRKPVMSVAPIKHQGCINRVR